MTQSPKLSDTLARLAELVPKRFEHDTEGTAGTFSIWRERDEPGVGLVSRSDFITYLGHDYRGYGLVSRTAMWTLREALELEIESRGWVWSLEVSSGNALAGIFHGLKCLATKVGDTPAHALALALVQALEAHHG